MQSLPPGSQALILGATGAIGGAIAAQLQADPRCTQVLALSRQSTPAIDFDQPDSIAAAAEALRPLGIEPMPGQGDPESDIGPMARQGMAWAWLGHDATRYFDLHHNADDTLDKIDPKDLAQNVAAYVVFAWLASQTEGDFGSAPKSDETARE